MHSLKALLQLLALQLFLLPSAATSVNATAAFGHSSEVPGRLPLTVKIKCSEVLPRNAVILVNLGLNNADCSRLVRASLPLKAFGGCEIVEGVFSLRTAANELPAGAEAEFAFDQIEHIDRQLAAFDVKVATAHDVSSTLRGYSESRTVVKSFGYFLLQPANEVHTCQALDVTVIGGLTDAVASNSLVEITFPSDMDISSISSTDLDNFQRVENTITGNTMNEYTDTFQLKLLNVIAPAAGNMLELNVIVHLPSGTFYQGTGGLVVVPEAVASAETIKLVANKDVCGKGKYTISIEKRCPTVKNAKFEIFPPEVVFREERVTVSSNIDLTGKMLLEFELINPCWVPRTDELLSASFIIVVTSGDSSKMALKLKAFLDPSTTYETGKLLNFKATPHNRNYGRETAYTYSMFAHHAVPKNGEVAIVIPPGSYASVGSAKVNGAETEAYYSAGSSIEVLVVVMPKRIPPLSHFEIEVGMILNPYVRTNVSFYAYTRNTGAIDVMDHMIDISGTTEVEIYGPALATVTSTSTNKKNLEQSVYTFTLVSRGDQIGPGCILGIRFPAEIDISTCAPVGVNIEPPDFGEKYERWIEILDYNSVSEASYWVNTFSFEYSCLNPPITQTPSSFEFGVFEAGGSKMIEAEGKVQNERGTHFDPRTSVECDSHCALCVAKCTLTIIRRVTHRFQTIAIQNSVLYPGNVGCEYTERGHKVSSNCIVIAGTFAHTTLVTINMPRKVSSMTISNVGIRHPQHSATVSFPFRVKTYDGKGEDPLKLIEEDEFGAITGRCQYPCYTCSRDPNMCDECMEDFLYFRELYLYPDGADLCDEKSDTNCRELEDGKCCRGYYLNEEGRRCHKCGEGCAVCSSAESCITCFDESHLFYKGECREECPDGYYLVGRECRTCDPNCRACSTEKGCTKCHENYKLHEKEATCVLRCPKGTGLVGDTCKTCGEGCADCRGWPTMCTRCAEDADAVKVLLPDTGECAAAEVCENGLRAVDSLDGICLPCVSECEECKGSPSSCSKCKTWEYLHETKKTCVHECGPYSYGVPSSDETNGICLPCRSDCLYCASGSECILCGDNNLYVPATKACVEACPWKHYERRGKCYPCKDSCVRCTSDFSCADCVHGYLLYQNVCLEETCPVGTFRAYDIDFRDHCRKCDVSCHSCQESGNSCIECAKGYYRHDRNCVGSCPAGTAAVGAECVACKAPCGRCTDSPDRCVSCTDALVLHKAQCVASCPPHTAFHPPLNVCVDCPTGCYECTWSEIKGIYTPICHSCSAGFKVVNSTCYLFCPNNSMETSDGLSCNMSAKRGIRSLRLHQRKDPIHYHLLILAALAFAVVVGSFINDKTFILSNLIVVINVIAVVVYASTFVVACASSKKVFAAFYGAALGLQMALNVTFMAVFFTRVRTGIDFLSWEIKNPHVARFVYVFSIIFSLQTYRILYSQFMGVKIFFVRFNNAKDFLRRLDLFSILQIILVLFPIIIFDLVELVLFPTGTRGHNYLMESFLLSFTLLLLLFYEMMTVEKDIDLTADKVVSEALASRFSPCLSMVEELREEYEADSEGEEKKNRAGESEGGNEEPPQEVEELDPGFRQRLNTSLMLSRNLEAPSDFVQRVSPKFNQVGSTIYSQVHDIKRAKSESAYVHAMPLDRGENEGESEEEKEEEKSDLSQQFKFSENPDMQETYNPRPQEVAIIFEKLRRRIEEREEFARSELMRLRQEIVVSEGERKKNEMSQESKKENAEENKEEEDEESGRNGEEEKVDSPKLLFQESFTPKSQEIVIPEYYKEDLLLEESKENTPESDGEFAFPEGELVRPEIKKENKKDEEDGEKKIAEMMVKNAWGTGTIYDVD